MTNSLVDAEMSRTEVKRYQITISGTSGCRISTPIVAFDLLVYVPIGGTVVELHVPNVRTGNTLNTLMFSSEMKCVVLVDNNDGFGAWDDGS